MSPIETFITSAMGMIPKLLSTVQALFHFATKQCGRGVIVSDNNDKTTIFNTNYAK